jgi:hypothetical protein
MINTKPNWPANVYSTSQGSFIAAMAAGSRRLVRPVRIRNRVNFKVLVKIAPYAQFLAKQERLAKGETVTRPCGMLLSITQCACTPATPSSKPAASTTIGKAKWLAKVCLRHFVNELLRSRP